MLLQTKIPVSQAPPLLQLPKVHTVSHLSRSAAVPFLLLVTLNTALLHGWMSAGDGSSAGVCAAPEAQRVPHVSRWAAVHLLHCSVFNTIAAPVENILLYTLYTPARRKCTIVQVANDSA